MDFSKTYAQKAWACAVAEHTRMQTWTTNPRLAPYAEKRIKELETKYSQLKS